MAVRRHYEASGHDCVADRWRGSGGELDLVVRRGAELVFIEVKSSSTHADAAVSLGARQIERIYSTGAEYLGQHDAGGVSDIRFDVALFDAAGRIEVLENAIHA
ncbi:MAG: YraN family protein [Shimia sp.]